MSHSNETRERIRQKALARGEAATAAVHAAVRQAMKDIDKEMAANGGIYPKNGGKVSKNEVYRRAGINETTISKDGDGEVKRYETLRGEVNAWLDALSRRAVTKRLDARRSQAERLADWAKLYDDLQATHHLTELELQDRESELQKKNEELETVMRALVDTRTKAQGLQAEVDRLTAALEAATSERVVSINKRRSANRHPPPA
jgi:predicted ribosome quality control (RQC) complex YloA/Tae2 family protein